MNNNIQTITRVRRLFHYFEDVKRGYIQVPRLRRDFIWTDKQKLELFDSIKKGYPIGSFSFWDPANNLVRDTSGAELQNIGAYKLPQKKTGFFYILDGYQRLSTLFNCLVNPTKTNLNRDLEKWNEDFNIFYNLEEEKFEFNRKNCNLKIHEVPIYKFIDGAEFYQFQVKLTHQGVPEEKVNDYLAKYRNFGGKITTYNIPTIDLFGGNLTAAIEIHSRLNPQGQDFFHHTKNEKQL